MSVTNSTVRENSKILSLRLWRGQTGHCDMSLIVLGVNGHWRPLTYLKTAKNSFENIKPVIKIIQNWKTGEHLLQHHLFKRAFSD